MVGVNGFKDIGWVTTKVEVRRENGKTYLSDDPRFSIIALKGFLLEKRGPSAMSSTVLRTKVAVGSVFLASAYSFIAASESLTSMMNW